MLRGVGYESNDASVITNVSSDHMDLQGIHTLPELAEVKSVITRITRPEGSVVLNADDELVAAIARRVRAPVALFSIGRGPAPRSGATSRAAAAAYVVERRLARGGGRRPGEPIVAGRRGARDARRPGPSQRRQRPGRRRRRAGPGRHASSRSRDGLRDFRPDGRAAPGG